MKLPFDLGVKLFFRLLLPGFFLTFGLMPVLFAVLDLCGYANQKDVAFVLATIMMGWIILAADMPIYMLLEGRRYWPRFLWILFRNREQARLGKLNEQISTYYTREERNSMEDCTDNLIEDEIIERRYLEASVGTRSFPLNTNGEPYAAFPTRLGNTLTSFESYADSRYGIDDVFYWPRIWVNLNKEIRDELDNQQAMADSTVYSSFALALTGLLWALYGLIHLIETLFASLITIYYGKNFLWDRGIFAHLPTSGTCFLISSVSLLLAYVVYRISVFTNEQFGTFFMAVIDTNVQNMDEWIDIKGIEKKITVLTNVHVDDEEKFEVARRYLQYFNVKLPGFSRAVPFPQVKNGRQTASFSQRQQS